MTIKAQVPNTHPVTIIGAGISGLASAFYLVRAGFRIDVYEKSKQAGGLISTLIKPEGKVETAANAFLNSSLVEEIADAIGVKLISPSKTARKRYISVGGKLRRFPLGLNAAFRVTGFALKSVLRINVGPHPKESVRDWARRTLSDEVSARLLEPALQGVYAGDPSRLSASLIIGRLLNRKERFKTRAKVRGSVSLAGGMSEFVTALTNYLEKNGVRFHYGKAFDVAQSTKGPIVVATSAPDAAILLEALGEHEKAEALRRIEMLPLVTATCFFKETDPASKGFGCVFAPREPHAALGVLKNDFIFPQRAVDDLHSETWIIGGAMNRASTELSEAALRELIVNEREKTFGLRENPVASYITKWPVALPHYTTELEGLQMRLREDSKHIKLVGNYLGEIGLSGILKVASRLPLELTIEEFN